MAKVIANENSLDSQIKDIKAKKKKWLLRGGIIFIVAGLLIPPAAPMILMVGLFLLFGKDSKERTIKAGLVGEQNAQKILEELSDDYTVLCDLSIEVEDRKSQLDFVIVGPTGIFVNEIKNLNGTIYGNANDHEWRQDKVGRQGGEYSKTFYNPTKQVGTHVYRLSRLLKNNKINFWVTGMVYFTNPDVDVNVNTDKIPVFSYAEDGGKELIDFIQNQREKSLTSEQVDEVVNILVNQSSLEGAA